jgi:bifunctional non-homologous end joining protein LigD
MAARVVGKLPEGDKWSYEVKFDGYRELPMKDGERLRIRSRNDKDLTHAYPSVAAAGRRLQARQAVIDGEIVAIDLHGRPSFQALQHRAAHPGHTIAFYAFDLLHSEDSRVTAATASRRFEAKLR